MKINARTYLKIFKSREISKFRLGTAKAYCLVEMKHHIHVCMSIHGIPLPDGATGYTTDYALSEYIRDNYGVIFPVASNFTWGDTTNLRYGIVLEKFHKTKFTNFILQFSEHIVRKMFETDHCIFEIDAIAASVYNGNPLSLLNVDLSFATQFHRTKYKRYYSYIRNPHTDVYMYKMLQCYPNLNIRTDIDLEKL